MFPDPTRKDQGVEPPERGNRLADGALGLATEREIRRDVCLLADGGCAPAPARHDSRPFGDELPDDVQTDPAGRAGDETDPACKTEVHGSLR